MARASIDEPWREVTWDEALEHAAGAHAAPGPLPCVSRGKGGLGQSLNDGPGAECTGAFMRLPPPPSTAGRRHHSRPAVALALAAAVAVALGVSLPKAFRRRLLNRPSHLITMIGVAAA